MNQNDQKNKKQKTLWYFIKLPFLHAYYFLFFPANSFMRFMVWTPLLLLALVLGSWAAWGLGYARYYYDGQPDDWETRLRQQNATRLISNISLSSRQNTNNQFIGLQLDLPEQVFVELVKRRGWWREGEEENDDNFYYLNSDVPLNWKTFDNVVSEISFVMPGFVDVTKNSMMTRMRNKYGPVKVTENRTINNEEVEVNIWWTDSVIIEFTWSEKIMKPYREPEKILTFKLIGSRHPDFPKLMPEYLEKAEEQKNNPANQVQMNSPQNNNPPRFIRRPINQ